MWGMCRNVRRNETKRMRFLLCGNRSLVFLCNLVGLYWKFGNLVIGRLVIWPVVDQSIATWRILEFLATIGLSFFGWLVILWLVGHSVDRQNWSFGQSPIRNNTSNTNINTIPNTNNKVLWSKSAGSQNSKSAVADSPVSDWQDRVRVSPESEWVTAMSL